MFLCGHINARSLLNGFDIFKGHLRDCQYDILGVSETWLHAGIAQNILNIDEFTFIRQDRCNRGGGVGVYIKNTLKFNTVFQECRDYIEHIWVEVRANKKNILVGNIYRPPNTDINCFVSYLEDILADFCTKFDSIIILGDFNVNMLNLNSSISLSLLNTVEAFNFKQIISEPTRITNTGSTLIDLIFCNFSVNHSGVKDIEISDHMLIFCYLDLGETEAKTYNFIYRQIHNIDMVQFLHDVANLPWGVMYRMGDIENKVNFFTDSILDIFNIHAPLKKVKGKKRPYQPWFTPNIRHMQTLRNKAFNNFKRTKISEHWQYYKELRNLTTSAIRREKRAYLNFKFNNCTQRQKWQELKKINVCSEKVRNLPENLRDVDELNKYFTEVSKNANPPNAELISFYNNNRLTESVFSFTLVSEELIMDILRNIKTKVFGSDDLNITLILLCCPVILRPLTHIINTCIENSYFPLKWKQANVVPLPKVDSPTDFSQLRSISILPTLSKVLEKIMELQMVTFLTANNIIPRIQSGFRAGYSCSTALSNVTDDIIRGLDCNRATILILLDFTKAFDMLNHEVLLSILNYVGFSDVSLQLVLSFLSNRVQRVVLDENTSDDLEVTSGVPQGSILGPLLYTVYTSQFEKSLSDCKCHLYADDTQVYLTFDPSNINLANDCINADLNNLLIETKKHLLKINPNKSVGLLFSNENVRENILNNINIRLDQNQIVFKNSAKNLGLILDYKLRFKEHINAKLRLGYSALRMLYCHRHYLNWDTRRMLCESLVLSPLNYCDSIYGPCLDVTDIGRIQKLQNACLRLIFGIRRRERISYKLKELKWLNMFNRRVLHATCFFYKVLKYKSPPYLFERVVYRTDVHNINIRRKNILTIPRHSKQFFKRSFSYSIASNINRFNVIDFSMSCDTFKKNLKTVLLNQQ